MEQVTGSGFGRKLSAVEVMLRIHMMQQWFSYSNPGMGEALHDVPMLREFSGLDAGEASLGTSLSAETAA